VQTGRAVDAVKHSLFVSSTPRVKSKTSAPTKLLFLTFFTEKQPSSFSLLKKQKAEQRGLNALHLTA